jgi:non-homologous end joining protein Ku
MYHAGEVRDFQQVPKGEKVNVSEKELELSIGLLDRLTSEEFNPENYKDEYRIRVLAMLDEKSKGKEVTISSAGHRNGAARSSTSWKPLKRSMKRIPAKKKPATPRQRRKRVCLKSCRSTDSNPLHSLHR